MAIAVRKNSDDRMLNANIADVPGFVQQRCNGDSEMHHLSLKQRRIGVRCGTMNDHTVKINRRAQAGQMESKVSASAPGCPMLRWLFAAPFSEDSCGTARCA